MISVLYLSPDTYLCHMGTAYWKCCFSAFLRSRLLVSLRLKVADLVLSPFFCGIIYSVNDCKEL